MISQLPAHVFSMFQLAKDPKILADRARVIFAMICLALLGYMIITQITRFFENKDTASFSYKKFGTSPHGHYPTFSICFKGTYVYWQNDEPLFDFFGIDSKQYELIMKGRYGARYEYARSSRLYKKVILDIRNVSNIGWDQGLYLNIDNLVKSSKSVFQHPMDSARADSRENENNMNPIEFYIGYQSADMICFTREDNDKLGLERLFDELVLDWEEFKRVLYGETEMSIYLHSPHQFWRASETPKFWMKFYDITGGDAMTIRTASYQYTIRLQISQVTVLRKRPNANEPCDELLDDEDDKLQREIAKHIKCAPPYWKKTLANYTEFEECQTAYQLRAADHYIKHYKEVMTTCKGPCTDMGILATNERTTIMSDNNMESVRIRIEYMEKYYQEILNGQEFGFESFWSAVGGFLGIFMGYSMLQLPDFVEYLYSVFSNIKLQKAPA